DRATHGMNVILSKIDAIQQDAPFRWIVEPREQLRQSRLACAVLAHACAAPARPQREAHMTYSPRIASGILKADIFEREAFSYRTGHCRRARRRGDRRLHLKEIEEVLEVETLLINSARAQQQYFDQLPASTKRARKKSQRADRQLSPRRAHKYDHVRAVVAQRAYEREQRADSGFAD